jgi:hypothetical protein
VQRTARRLRALDSFSYVPQVLGRRLLAIDLLPGDGAAVDRVIERMAPGWEDMIDGTSRDDVTALARDGRLAQQLATLDEDPGPAREPEPEPEPDAAEPEPEPGDEPEPDPGDDGHIDPSLGGDGTGDIASPGDHPDAPGPVAPGGDAGEGHGGDDGRRDGDHAAGHGEGR